VGDETGLGDDRATARRDAIDFDILLAFTGGKPDEHQIRIEKLKQQIGQRGGDASPVGSVPQGSQGEDAHLIVVAALARRFFGRLSRKHRVILSRAASRAAAQRGIIDHWT
jgi:hypothetical protein